MDTTKLRLGEVVAGASAILLFIVMFFHWYGVKGVVFGQTVEVGGVSAWRVYSYVDILLLILIILALGMVLLSATQRSTALPISTNVVVTGYGAIMTLIVLYRVVINQPGPNNLISVKFWGYVGLLLTAGVAVGAFMAMREEGTSFSDAAQRLQGAEAVVVGRSLLVGRPLVFLLLERNATVTVCHSRTRNLPEVCARADVLVAAVGSPRLLGADAVKPGAAVIDVGVNRLADGLAGDVDFDAAVERAGFITPVPGGVGPMTIAFLLRNTLRAARMLEDAAPVR